MVISVFLLYTFTYQTINEYINSPMRIQVSSTNTQMNEQDFPVLTFCPNNVVSYNKVMSPDYVGKNRTTFMEYKEVREK